MAALTLFSPAKINLYLRILRRRADGYHELETVMAPLSFGDNITLEPQKSGVALTCSDKNLPADDTNLAVRAAKLFAERMKIRGRGVKISLEKRIPLAAGLGGGSSNAATVLLGLNELWDVGAPLEKLHEIAADLGSDINFFLQKSAAICRGRGEMVEPIPCSVRAKVLLVNLGFGISTKWAYEKWAAMAKNAPTLTAPAPESRLLVAALERGDVEKLCGALHNSLEKLALEKFPILQLLKDFLRENGAAGALMSGSGATVFGIFEEGAALDAVVDKLRAEFGADTWTAVAQIATAP
jgi:4-diphosphocytidyl-2-C-methyl-D-erythritol kinase